MIFAAMGVIRKIPLWLAAKADIFRRRIDFSEWEHGASLSMRRYDSYEDYVKHQAAKLETVVDRLKANADAALDGFRKRFSLAPEIVGLKTALCLGARLGQEVQALIERGMFAVGVDLNPGEKNPYVVTGDFHQLQFADESVDLVYTNVLDHVFDLARLVKEVERVLRPGGVFLVDVVKGYEEGFYPDEFEAMHWPTVDSLVKSIALDAPLVPGPIRSLAGCFAGSEAWMQVAFRKPA